MAAVGSILRLIVVAGLLFVAGCSSFGHGFEGTVLCQGSTAEVIFERGEQLEVKTSNATVGWADAGGRGVDEDVCKRVPVQKDWFVGIQYAKLTNSARLRCRFTDFDSFHIHVHPVYTSEGSEDFPSGSALYVVLPKSRTIVVSGSIVSKGSPGDLSYSKDYCVEES